MKIENFFSRVISIIFLCSVSAGVLAQSQVPSKIYIKELCATIYAGLPGHYTSGRCDVDLLLDLKVEASFNYVSSSSRRTTIENRCSSSQRLCRKIWENVDSDYEIAGKVVCDLSPTDYDWSCNVSGKLKFKDRPTRFDCRYRNASYVRDPCRDEPGIQKPLRTGERNISSLNLDREVTKITGKHYVN